MKQSLFEYDQAKLQNIAAEILNIIENKSLPSNILEVYQNALYLTCKTYIYIQRIDCVESGSDDYIIFDKRIMKDLQELDKLGAVEFIKKYDFYSPYKAI